jgi:DNA-binding NtrC family response regulator
MAKYTILCVDDEKTVITSLRQELELAFGRNFNFELAESAEEGLEIIGELLADGGTISLVISDQFMPGMKGDEFLVAVNKIDPNIGKILLTGDTAGARELSMFAGMGHLRITSKPWDSRELQQMVRELTQKT